MTSGDLTPEDRQRINDLFHQALELDAAERPAFVRRACEDAPVIRDEVLSLLEAHERPDPSPLTPVSADARALAGAAAQAEALIGQQLGQYRINRIVGHGGMGVVYEADDSKLGRIVALKALSPDVARDPVRRERLRREARVAAPFNHPGIATVYALEEFGDDLFLAAEFVPGETLRDELRRGPVDPGRLLHTAIELAHALGAAHNEGVIHRDLKPENVIRMPDDHVKILDFGLARLRDSTDAPALTVDGAVFGTPGYMAPEQFSRGPLDPRSDLFSLGVMLYELLAGEHPFGGTDSATTIGAILERDPRPFRAPGEARPTDPVRAGLESVIGTLLRKTPSARFASAHQLRAALERIQAGQAVTPFLPSPATDSVAIGWWKFHQASACAFYVLLLLPIGMAGRVIGADGGMLLFLAAVAAVVASVTLRAHLWFAATSMPDEFDHQQRKTVAWVRAADWLLAAVAIASGLAVYQAVQAYAVVLIISGVVSIVASAFIEPATTRVAFGRTNEAS